MAKFLKKVQWCLAFCRAAFTINQQAVDKNQKTAGTTSDLAHSYHMLNGGINAISQIQELIKIFITAPAQTGAIAVNMNAVLSVAPATHTTANHTKRNSPDSKNPIKYFLNATSAGGRTQLCMNQ